MIQNVSLKIPPNYSSWQTIEYSYEFCMKMIVEKIPGDFVECGIAAGNNFGAMCLAGRHGWGFDSFEGIPWAGKHDDQQPGMIEKPKVMKGKTSGISSHSMADVDINMKRWGITNYSLVKGWFKDTIPGQPFVKQISVLRLDGDLYDSTMIPLTNLYPLLSTGGVLIVDDIILNGCKKAFNDYFYNIRPMQEIVTEDENVKYFKKI